LLSLKVEQAFDLSDTSAKRAVAGCTITLNKEPIIEYLRSNVAQMENLIAMSYQNKRTLERRIESVHEWLASP
jgi:aconitate hydratase 2/2-methylisocitrate dehydratase